MIQYLIQVFVFELVSIRTSSVLLRNSFLWHKEAQKPADTPVIEVTHQNGRRCSRSPAGWGDQRCLDSTGSGCVRPEPRCHPALTRCGWWAERTTVLPAAPTPTDIDNTEDNWGPGSSARPRLDLKKTKKHRFRNAGLLEKTRSSSILQYYNTTVTPL